MTNFKLALGLVGTLATGCVRPSEAITPSAEAVDGQTERMDVVNCDTVALCEFRADVNECLDSPGQYEYESYYGDVKDYCVERMAERHQESAERRENRARRRAQDTSPQMAYFNALVDECDGRESQQGAEYKRFGPDLDINECRILIYEQIQQQCSANPEGMGAICGDADVRDASNQ